MPRVKRGTKARARRKKILDAAEGRRHGHRRLIKTARDSVIRGGKFAFRDRKRKKGDMRGIWIQRLNAAVREHGLSYSRFIHGLKKAGVSLDRKVLAELALDRPDSFKVLVETARAA